MYINQNLSRIERQKAYDLRCKRRALRSKSRGNAVSVAGTSDNLVLQSPSHGISDQGSSFVPASNTVDIESIQVQPIRVITNSTRRTFQPVNVFIANPAEFPCMPKPNVVPSTGVSDPSLSISIPSQPVISCQPFVGSDYSVERARRPSGSQRC